MYREQRVAMVSRRTEEDPSSSKWFTNPEARLLEDIAESLRCPLCKEIFTKPQALPCRHTFCSECIDRAITKKNECPTCFLLTQPRNICRAWALDNLVNAYGDMRRSYGAAECDSHAVSFFLCTNT